MIFMLLFKLGSSLLLMFLLWEFWGQVCPKLLLWLFGDEGRICCCFSLSSFHLEVVIVGLCLAYLPFIYVGSLACLLRPLCPRHLRICPGTQIAQFCGKQNCFFQDLWANQCCCTDRFSPISTVPSDENIVDWVEAPWDLPHQAALRKRRTWPNAVSTVSVAAPGGPCPKWGTHSGLWPKFSVFLRCLAHELVSHVSKPFLTNRVVGFADYQLAANRRRVACQRCCQNLCSPWPLEAFSDSLARAATGRPYRPDTLQAERLPSRLSSHSWIWRSARWERCTWTPMAQHWKRLLPGRLCSAL